MSRRKLPPFIEGRRCCFTIHNYTPAMEHSLKTWKRFSYLVYGHEICPDTGTPHLQGYAEFNSSVKRFTLHNLIGVLFNCTVPISSAATNRAYCVKADTDGFVELGSFKSAGCQRNDITDVKLAIASGSSMAELCSLASGYQALRHGELLLKYTEPVPERTLKVIPCSGLDDVFLRIPKDNWGSVYTPISLDNWDGYDGHDIVHLPVHGLPLKCIQKFLRPYPFRVNTKGGSRQAAYKVVYVTGHTHCPIVEKFILRVSKDALCSARPCTDCSSSRLLGSFQVPSSTF